MTAMPSDMMTNAWVVDGGASGDVAPTWEEWAGDGPSLRVDGDLWASKADPADVTNAAVGWGLIMLEDPTLGDEEKADGEDAPEPLRVLLDEREGVVLRYDPDGPTGFLRRYYHDGHPQDIDIAGGAAQGVDRGEMPRYLLIHGPPTSIPWSLQFQLNAGHAVGRLDLDDEELARYVEAAVDGWSNSTASRRKVVIWAVDHGPDDITRLMRGVLARPLHDLLLADGDLAAGATYLTDGDATASRLIDALVVEQPALVVTTSHGLTWPLDDRQRLLSQVGLPVDVAGSPLDLGGIATWDPDGAVWVCQACCSAGTDASTSFVGLFEHGSTIAEMLAGLSDAGASTAPLPRSLLGAERPARAFIGHVEPTFDWTLRQPLNNQPLGHDLVDGLYETLFQAHPVPVGLAMQRWHQRIADLALALDTGTHGPTTNADYVAWCRLALRDRASLVLLGDPAVPLEDAQVQTS